MKKTSGKTILLGARRASSSACWRRWRLRSAAWMRSAAAQARAQLFRLDDGVRERLQVGHAGALAHVVHRLATGLAHRHFAQHRRELVGDRAAQLVRHPLEGGVEPQAGLHAGRHQVEGIRQAAPDDETAAVGAPSQPDERQQRAQQGEEENAQERPLTTSEWSPAAQAMIRKVPGTRPPGR